MSFMLLSLAFLKVLDKFTKFKTLPPLDTISSFLILVPALDKFFWF